MKTETTYIERLAKRQKLLTGKTQENANAKLSMNSLGPRFQKAKNSTSLNKRLLGIDPPANLLLPRSRYGFINS
jgi:hypothetical protein